MNKPNLFIVGAPKAGTTFLFEKLKDHPDLFFPKIKELNHFSADILKKRSYYKDYKIEDREKYLAFYKSAVKEKYLIDASVSYFAFPEIPKKIKKFNPQAKIVIITRNPLDRAFSHYQMDKRMGYAKLNFKEYLDKNKFPFHYHQYIENGLYMKYLSGYIELFGRENVLVLKLEDLNNDIYKFYSFLRITSDFEVARKEIIVNPNKSPKNFIATQLQRNRDLVSKLKMIVPRSFVKKFDRFLYKPAPMEKMTLEEKDFTAKLFEKDQREFFKFFQ